MRAMTKKLLSALVVLAMVLSMVPVVGLPAITADAAVNPSAAWDAATNRYCPYCNNAEVEWTALTDRIGILSDGQAHHYYLTGNIEHNTTSWFASASTSTTKIHINMNGWNVTATTTSVKAFSVSGDVALFNTSATPSTFTSGDNSNAASTNATNRVVYLGNSAGRFTLGAGVTLAALSGNNQPIVNITKGTFVLDGGTVSAAGSSAKAVQVRNLTSGTSAFVMNSGSIVAGTAANTVEVGQTSAAGQINKAELKGGTITGNVANQAGSVTLEGNVSISGKAYITANGKLTVNPNWTGTATAHFAAGLTEDEKAPANAVASGAFTGTLTEFGTGRKLVWDNASGLKLEAPAAAKIGTTEYATAQLAVNAAQAGDVVVLLANATIEIAEGKTVTVDAAGFDVTVTGEGTLKAIDSANDTYDATKCGTWTISNVTNWVTEANGGKYVLVAEETAGTYTAHRLDIRVSAVNLRTTQAGLYYTAEYKCDADLAAKVKTYGVALSLTEVPTALASSAYTAIETATKPLTAAGTNTYTTNSGAVVNILTEGNAENAANAIKAVKANAYLEINTGANEPVVVMGIADTDDGASYSLADVLDTINDGWNETWMIEAAKTLVAQFYKKWSTAFEAVTGYDFSAIAQKASEL